MVGFDAIVKGEVVVDQGFTDFILVDAVAVVTQGFLFACSDIWANLSKPPPVTPWVADSSVTTSWADANPAVVTIWTPPSGGIYGDC